jgi:hypothetical protein
MSKSLKYFYVCWMFHALSGDTDGREFYPGKICTVPPIYIVGFLEPFKFNKMKLKSPAGKP